MYREVSHKLLSRKWLILLFLMLLPTIFLKASRNDERSSFYKYITLASFKSRFISGNYTNYYGALLVMSYGTIELGEHSYYKTYVNGDIRQGIVHLDKNDVLKIYARGCDSCVIRMYCDKNAQGSASINEEKSGPFLGTVSNVEDRELSMLYYHPDLIFKSSISVDISSINIYSFFNIEGSQYKFDIGNKKWILSKVKIASDSISVKSNITYTYSGETYPLASIDHGAFANITTIKKLHVPSSIKEIGKSAFSECSNIERIYIDDVASWRKINFENKYSNPLHGSSKLYIGKKEVNEIECNDTINQYAFVGCPSIQKLKLDSDIKKLGDYAFSECDNLKNIYSYSLTPLSISGNVFSSTTYAGTLYVPRNVLETYRNKYPWRTFAKIAAIEGPDCDFEVNGLYYNVVDLVNRTCEVTFDTPYYSSYNQEKIVIPESVQYQGRTFQVVGISHDAFNGSKLVKKLTIPKSIKTVGKNAFLNCTGLSELNIDNSIDSVYADMSKLPLTTVKFTGAGTVVPKWLKNNGNLKSVIFDCPNVVTVADSAFYKCTSLTTIELPHSIKQIGIASFSGCEKLIDFRMPQQLDSIREYAFYNCKSLKDLNFESNLKAIGTEAFLGCTNLSTLTITAGIDSIANSAFNGCTGITTLNIADTESSIIMGYDKQHSYGLFSSIPLKNVYIGRDLICHSDKTPFNRNTDIDTLVIGHYVNDFPDVSLTKLAKMKRLVLGNKLEAIPPFSECSKLEELQIGSHIKTIPNFNNIQSLKKIKVYAGKPQTLTADFSNKTYIDCELLVPKGTIARYQEADKWKSFFNITEYSADCKAESLRFKQERFNVYPEESFDVESIVFPLDASEVYAWASSDNNVATVDEYGHVTSHNDGETIITATTTDGTNLTAACNVLVKKLVPVESISFEQSNYKVTIGQKANLVARITPTNVSYNSLDYVSSDTTIVSVSSNGEVNGLKVGMCTITVSSTDGTNVKATCEIEVLPIYVTNLTINCDKTQMVEGETMQLTISYEPENATIPDVLWEMSDSTIATISKDGVLTACKDGVVSIKAIAKDGSTVFDCKEIEILPLLQSSIIAPTNPPSNQIMLKWGAASYVKNVKDYNVYVSEDDGPYLLWLHNTTSTAALFGGKTGKKYRFIVTMRDKNGKVERYNEEKAVVVNL